MFFFSHSNHYTFSSLCKLQSIDYLCILRTHYCAEIKFTLFPKIKVPVIVLSGYNDTLHVNPV
jgi:hypothetical protein